MNIKEKLLHYSWDLAFGTFNDKVLNDGFDIKSVNIVKNPYPTKWFADPFILSSDDCSLTLLVEEFDYSIGRGRIAKIVVDKTNNSITECKVILDLPTHLSFPAIYEYDGKIYVHPENHSTGSSIIYEYDYLEERLVNPTKLLDEPLTDAIIVACEESYKIVSTKDPAANGNKLYVYESGNFLGPYKLKNEICYPNSCARMAGHLINNCGHLIRPAQDCNGAYGRAVYLMDGLNVINTLKPSGVKYAGLHTFNVKDGVFVIDLKRYDFPLFYYLKEKIKQQFL